MVEAAVAEVVSIGSGREKLVSLSKTLEPYSFVGPEWKINCSGVGLCAVILKLGGTIADAVGKYGPT